MTEVSFEQKFGQLADAQINEKLPALVEHRIGFQVIDKTDDDKKAVGVAAFIVNDLWLYIPVFFLKGDIKGLDLIYVKQQDLFVPALDNWIASIKEYGTKELGFTIDSAEADSYERRATPENTQILDTYTEMGKAASLDSNSIIDSICWAKMCRHLAPVDTSNFKAVDLQSDIPKLGKQASRAFLNTLLDNSDFSNAMFSFYSVDEVENLAKEAAFYSSTPDKPKSEDVLIVSDIYSKEASDLADREKELLVRNGIYVKDQRTNLSKVFQEEVDSSVMQNPSMPGIYNVLLSDGSFKNYILLFPKTISEPSITSRRFSNNTDRPVCMIDVDDSKKYTSKRNTEIFCKPATKIDNKDLEAVQGGDKATRTALSSLDRDTGVLFVQSPSNSIETRIINREGNADGSFSITVLNTAGHSDGVSLGSGFGINTSTARVEFVPASAQLRLEAGCLFIPEGTRMFVSARSYDKDAPKYPKQHTPKEVSLGNSYTVLHSVIFKQANLRHLRVHSSGNTAQITFGEDDTGLLTKEAALSHLIWRHGVEGGQAIQMLKEAQKSSSGTKGYLIKHAGPYDIAAYGYSTPPWMGGPNPSQEEAVSETDTVTSGVPLDGSMSSDGQPAMPQQVIDQAMQAAQKGIKEVFDVKILQGLVDKADVSELRKDYISDMIVGMDKIGRMLFLFYWHNDDFEERYGKDDLSKLEETLLNVFKSTGDLVLFLREKTSENESLSEDMYGALSQDISV